MKNSKFSPKLSFRVKVILSFLFLICLTYTPQILIKVLLGQAYLVGKRISANVYTNGKLDRSINVYEYSGSLLLYREDRKNQMEVVCIDLNRRFVGKPISIGEDSFKIYYGYLFQSETGRRFVRFNDGAKWATRFDPELKFVQNEVSFKMRPDVQDFNCHSIRIIRN